MDEKWSFSASICESISQTITNTATITINHQQVITHRWFAVDFFTRGLIHTAVVRLPLHQLGFLVMFVVNKKAQLSLIDWLSMVLRLRQHNIGYTADSFFTGLMTQPTVSKHWRRVVSHPDRPHSNHAHLTVLQYLWGCTYMHADITQENNLTHTK